MADGGHEEAEGGATNLARLAATVNERAADGEELVPVLTNAQMKSIRQALGELKLKEFGTDPPLVMGRLLALVNQPEKTFRGDFLTEVEGVVGVVPKEVTEQLTRRAGALRSRLVQVSRDLPKPADGDGVDDYTTICQAVFDADAAAAAAAAAAAYWRAICLAAQRVWNGDTSDQKNIAEEILLLKGPALAEGSGQDGAWRRAVEIRGLDPDDDWAEHARQALADMPEEALDEIKHKAQSPPSSPAAAGKDAGSTSLRAQSGGGVAGGGGSAAAAAAAGSGLTSLSGTDVAHAGDVAAVTHELRGLSLGPARGAAQRHAPFQPPLERCFMLEATGGNRSQFFLLNPLELKANKRKSSSVQLVNSVRDLVQRCKYFGIYGPRQSMKTATAVALRDVLGVASPVQPFLVSLLNADKDTEAATVQHVADLIMDQARLPTQQLATWPALLGWCARQAAKASRYAVLLLDEYDGLAMPRQRELACALRDAYTEMDGRAGTAWTDYLSSLSEAEQVQAMQAPCPPGWTRAPCSVILVGMHRPEDIKGSDGELVFGGPDGKSPFNHSHTIDLDDQTQGFALEDIQQLFGMWESEGGPTLTREAAEELLGSTNGQPWLVNRIGAFLQKWRAAAAAAAGVQEIVAEDVRRAINAIVAAVDFRASASRPVTSHFGHLLRCLKRDPGVLRAVADVLGEEPPAKALESEPALGFASRLGLISTNSANQHVAANEIYQRVLRLAVLRLRATPTEQDALNGAVIATDSGDTVDWQAILLMMWSTPNLLPTALDFRRAFLEHDFHAGLQELLARAWNSGRAVGTERRMAAPRGQPKRCDILLYDRNVRPVHVAELKVEAHSDAAVEPHVLKAARQAASYATHVGLTAATVVFVQFAPKDDKAPGPPAAGAFDGDQLSIVQSSYDVDDVKVQALRIRLDHDALVRASLDHLAAASSNPVLLRHRVDQLPAASRDRAIALYDQERGEGAWPASVRVALLARRTELAKEGQ